MYLKPLIAGVASLIAMGAAQADADFKISGFGTIGYVQTNTNDVTYATGGNRFRYGGTKSGDFGPDTKFGLQITGELNDTFSVTAQAFAQQDVLGDYGPTLEWAFVKGKVSPSLDVRVGRMGGPFFMTSDFRNVGYTNLSVRTPPDVYAANPVRSFDGIDFLYRNAIGDATINWQLYAGKSMALVDKNFNAVLHNQTGLSVTAEIGSLTLRAGHVRTIFGSEGDGVKDFNTLTAGLKQVGTLANLPVLTTLSEDLEINGKAGSFTGIGALYDTATWVMGFEATARRTNSLFINDVNSGYVTLGYHVGKVTPYVSYSNRTIESAKSVSAPPMDGYPGFLKETVGTLIRAVNTEVLGDQTQRTAAIGARWDVGNGIALKGEYAQVSVPAGSNGLFSNVKRGSITNGTTVNVLSIALDFVF